MKWKHKKKVIVTWYDEYPIYEPAEGGYYYAGREYSKMSEPYPLKKAKRWLKQEYKKLRKIYGDRLYMDDECGIHYISEYIGEGFDIVIERPQDAGKDEIGHTPYC